MNIKRLWKWIMSDNPSKSERIASLEELTQTQAEQLVILTKMLSTLKRKVSGLEDKIDALAKQ